MAENVTGETYYDIDGQLQEIKRQLRQRGGYPYSIEMLKQALQMIIEGGFVEIGTALYSFFTSHGEVNYFPFSLCDGQIVKFGKPLLRDIVVPVQLNNGTYCIIRFESHRRGTIVNFPAPISDYMNDAQKMPVIKWVRFLEGVGSLWRFVVTGQTHEKCIEFYFKEDELIIMSSWQEPIGHGHQPNF